jgi:hypothetical protein
MNQRIAFVLPLVAALLATSCATGGSEKATPAVAPAAAAGPVPSEVLDPGVTPETIAATICQADYAKRARAPDTVTGGIKLRLLNQHGLSEGSLYRLEQRMPLELGGHPSDPRNFTLEYWDTEASANRKLQLLRVLQGRVCDRQMGLREAQAAYFTDWRAAYERYIKLR